MNKENPIRILNLFTILDRGGAETLTMNYYRKIDRSKVQFDFMVHRNTPGAYEAEIEALGGRIYRMPPIRPWSGAHYRTMVRKFYAEHPEYRIIHSHMSELGYYDFIEAKDAGIPVRICHAHSRPYGLDLKSPVRWYYKTRMLPYITHMFMCGEVSGEWLFGKKNHDRFIQMNNAIDANLYRFDLDKRNAVRSALGVPDDNIVVGHVGRFVLPKNHKFILEIFNALHRAHPKTSLLLIGNDTGDLGNEIHEKVAAHGLQGAVQFLGVRSDVSDLLQGMDVFLFPSLFEGLSVASIEAQAAGLPVILSDTVSLECKKTNLVHVVSLKAAPSVWAEKVWEAAHTERTDRYEEIRSAGFDIEENAKWLEQVYLNLYQGEDTRGNDHRIYTGL